MGLTSKGQPGGLATLNTGGRLASAQASGSQAYLNGLPSGTFRVNMNRDGVVSNLSALATQVMLDTALYLEAGDIVTALTFVSGATAASSPTNWWFALYDTAATPALLAQTADQLTAAWGANTAVKLNLAAPYTVPATGVYRAAVMVKATTPPTLLGSAVQAAASVAVAPGQKILASTSGSGLTGTAPATVATPTAVGNVPYVIAS